MRLSVFVSSLGWASIFAHTWLWSLGKIRMDGLHIVLFILFWVIAILAGLWSMNDLKPKPR